jgi:hypothetical protein
MSFESKTAPDAGSMKLSFMTSFAKLSRQVSLTVVFLTWGMHAMAAPDDKPITAASNVVVTLNVFSGKPNPTWTLADGQPVEFLRRLRELHVSKAAAREADNLGYRAVSVEFQDQTKAAVMVKASRGVVTLDRSGQQSHYIDAGRQFELWLVHTGDSHLAPDILRYVTGEIAKPQ